DFGATWHAWWSDDPTPVRHFRVTVQGLTILNNLDHDSGDDAMNPTITPDGEWNMFVDAGGNWTNLHDTERGPSGDYVPELGDVRTALPDGRPLSTARVPVTDLFLTD